MALEGNLSEFGLAEILQLVSVQQKTGMLTVSNEGKSATMFFRDGALISTRDRRTRHGDPLRDYLTRYGVLSRQDLDRVDQILSQSKLDLLDILQSEGFLSEKELADHFRKLVQETLHDVLSWDQCRYKFVTSSDIVTGIKSTAEFHVESMLMESMRRVDEFPRYLQMFPSEAILVTRIGEPTEDQLGEMTSGEKAIFAMLENIVSIEDLIAQGKMPVFEVYEALKNLKDKKLIKAKDETPKQEAIADLDDDTPVRERKPVGAVFPLLGALAVLAVAGFIGFKSFDVSMASVPKEPAQLQQPEVLGRQVEARLRWTLDTYRATFGQYPAQLSALVKTGLATDNLIKQAEEHGLDYRLTPGGTGYTLL